MFRVELRGDLRGYLGWSLVHPQEMDYLLDRFILRCPLCLEPRLQYMSSSVVTKFVEPSDPVQQWVY